MFCFVSVIAMLGWQRESCSAASTEAHSNPYVMDQSTFTNNNGALPAEGSHPNHNIPTGGPVLPPHRLNELPQPGKALFLEENAIYRPTVNNNTVKV